MQFLIIGFILLFSSAILTCCVNISIDVTRLTNKIYASNHADYYVISSYGTSKVLKDKVGDLKTIKCYKANDKLNVYHKNKTMLNFQSETYYVVLYNYKTLDWIITPKEGNLKEKGPKEGEVWVEKIISDAHNVKVSDNYVIDNENKDKLKGNERVDFNIIKSNKSKDEIQKIIEKNFTDNDTLYNIRGVDDLKTSAKMINELSTGLGIIASFIGTILGIPLSKVMGSIMYEVYYKLYYKLFFSNCCLFSISRYFINYCLLY